MKELSVEYVSIDSLIPHPKNMHQHSDEQIDRLCKIIEYQGFRTPLTVQKGTNLIVCGHGRLIAAKKLGFTELPVIYQEFESEEQLYAHIVADNAIGKDTWATLDISQINKDILDLGPELDIDMLGLKDFVIEPIEKLDPQCDEDETPEVENPITKRGDVWLLGKHRLMCGDSTMIDDVEKLMNGERADMVFTDPPYGVSYTGGVIHGNSINVDNKRRMLKNDDDVDIYKNWLSLIGNYIDNGALYIFYAIKNSERIFTPLKDFDFEISAVIAWNKINTGYADMNSHYKNKYEPCVYAKKKGKSLNWQGDTKQNTVWDIEKDRDNKMHPTQKPVAVPERAIVNSSKMNQLVLDSFLGSGSTLIACEKTNRKCYGMELDEHYCDVIINRYINFTGRDDVILESTGQKYSELNAQHPNGIKE